MPRLVISYRFSVISRISVDDQIFNIGAGLLLDARKCFSRKASVLNVTVTIDTKDNFCKAEFVRQNCQS